MNHNQEVCVVIRDEKGEVQSVLVSQVHIKTHVMYNTVKSGIDDILTRMNTKPLEIKPIT